jgi:peptidyl-prolyl cis-trans isomerase C
MVSIWVVCAVAALTLGADQGRDAGAAGDRAVARAGAVSVSADELGDAVLDARKSGDTKRVLSTLTPEGLERLALDILERKVLATAGRGSGVDRDPVVQRAAALAVDTVVAQAFVAKAVAALDLTDVGVRRYFDAHQADFRLAPRRRAHHIVVATRAEAEAALAEVRAGGRFEAVASAKNTDQTKVNGGDLGWVARGAMVKAFDEALFALGGAGDVSGVVATSFGFHVIRLDEIDPGRLPAFDGISVKVRSAMVAEVRRRLTSGLAQQYPVTVDRDALAKVGR